MCPPVKKQSVNIIGIPANGSFTQYIPLRFTPKVCNIKQIFLSDSAAATICTVYCRQMSLDPFCVVQAITAATGEIQQPYTSVELRPELVATSYTFTFEIGGIPLTTIDLITMILEFEA